MFISLAASLRCALMCDQSPDVEKICELVMKVIEPFTVTARRLLDESNYLISSIERKDREIAAYKQERKSQKEKTASHTRNANPVIQGENDETLGESTAIKTEAGGQAGADST